MRKQLLPLIALIACTTGARGDEGGVDLMQAWQSARSHDAAFAAAESERAVAEQQRRQSRALRLPQVQASGLLGRASVDNRMSGAQFSTPAFGSSTGVDFRTDIDNGRQHGWVLSAEQPIYDAGRFASARQPEQQAYLTEARYTNAKQELILRVAQAFVDLALARDTETLLGAEQQAARRALDEAQARYQSGDIPVTDATESQARFDAVAAQLLATQTDSEIKRSAFIDITGIDPLQLLTPDVDTEPDGTSLAAWQQRADASNPLLAMQTHGVEIARADIDRYRALTSPVVSLVAQLNDQSLRGDGAFGNAELQGNGWMVGVQVTVPIFTGGMRSARHAEAIARSDQARADLRAVQQAVARQTQAAWLGVTSGAARVRALEQARQSAQLRLQATELGHDNGARSTLELLNAQTDAFAAERALREARYTLLMNHLRLRAAAGTLDEESLQAAAQRTANDRQMQRDDQLAPR